MHTVAHLLGQGQIKGYRQGWSFQSVSRKQGRCTAWLPAESPAGLHAVLAGLVEYQARLIRFLSCKDTGFGYIDVVCVHLATDEPETFKHGTTPGAT